MNDYNQDWFGKQAQIVETKKDFMKIEYGCHGKGDVYCFSVFAGIQMMIIDVDTADVITTKTYEHDIICITYVLKGRYEVEFANHCMSYIPELYFTIYNTVHLPVSTSFPLHKCLSVSLVIDLHHLDEKAKSFLLEMGIDVLSLTKHLNLDHQWYIAKINDDLKDVFMDIYNGIDKYDSYYIKIKVLEILYHMEKISQNKGCDFQYFDKGYIQSTKNIQKYMISHLDEKISLATLTKQYQINLSLFHKIFLQIYGDTPYAYLKKYKMNIAAGWLLNEDRKINEIAISLGYHNASKFALAFQSVYGMLPKDYRKQK